MITVDGDMSTNDAVFALANGLAGEHARSTRAAPEYAALAEALEGLCTELARQIAEDGEGATKLVEVRVSGAPDAAMARDLARAVAGSSLVKAAIFGADPNWGRVLSAIGARVGSRKWPIDPDARHGARPGHVRVRRAAPRPASTRWPCARRCASRTSRIDVKLAEGAADAVAWGCDLSLRLREDQRRLHEPHARRRPTARSRATTGSPTTARASSARSLVEALSYIAQVHQHARGREVRRRGDGEGLAQGELRERHQPAAERGPAAHRGARRRARDHAHDGEARPRQERVRRRRAHHGPRGREGRRDGADGQDQHRARVAARTSRARTRSASRARTRGSSARASSRARAGATSGWWAR